MLEKFGYTEPVRVCDACYETVEASKRRAALHIRSQSNVVRALKPPLTHPVLWFLIVFVFVVVALVLLRLFGVVWCGVVWNWDVVGGGGAVSVWLFTFRTFPSSPPFFRFFISRTKRMCLLRCANKKVCLICPLPV